MLGADRYERSEDKLGYRNGNRPCRRAVTPTSFSTPPTYTVGLVSASRSAPELP